MILIDDKQFKEAFIGITFQNNANQKLLNSPIVGELLKRYLILSQYPEKFDNLNRADIYYNRYYWFLKFLVTYQKKHKHDVGIEQQEFKLLEEGDNIPNIDWHIIENISNEIRG
jgi:hypothetical protein